MHAFFHRFTIASFCLCMPALALCATPIMSVTSMTNTTSIELAPSDSTTETFTITNNTGKTLAGPTFGVNHSTSNTTPSIDSSSTCSSSSSLASGASCTLVINITANAAGIDTLTPRACAVNGLACSGLAAPITITIYSSTPAATGILYGGYENASSTDLLQINPTTAQATNVATLTSGPFNQIAADNNYLYHWHSVTSFDQIDPNTFSSTAIGISGGLGGITTAAVFYNNAFFTTGILGFTQRAFFNNSLQGAQSLITTPTSSQITGGMACLHHRIYAINSGTSVDEINPSTGAVISSTPLTISGHTLSSIAALTVDPGSQLFYALAFLDGSADDVLVRVNISSGVVTSIGNITLNNSVLPSGTWVSSLTTFPADASCS